MDLDIDDKRLLYLLATEPFEDSQLWNGKERQCSSCGHLHKRRGDCQKCKTCGEDDCTCRDCYYCGEHPNFCKCKLCRTCGDPEDHVPSTRADPRLGLCRCTFCVQCGKKEREGCCEMCQHCSSPGTHCRCRYRPVCTHKAQSCNCETCPPCKVKWKDCSRFKRSDRKVSLNDSQLIQVIDTQELNNRRWVSQSRGALETIHMRGNSLEEYRVIAVKRLRPSLARCKSRYQSNMRYRYRQVKDLISRSALCKLLEPHYNQLQFYFEVDQQPSNGLYHDTDRISSTNGTAPTLKSRLPPGSSRWLTLWRQYPVSLADRCLLRTLKLSISDAMEQRAISRFATSSKHKHTWSMFSLCKTKPSQPPHQTTIHSKTSSKTLVSSC